MAAAVKAGCRDEAASTLMEVAWLCAPSLAFAEQAARSATMKATASRLARTATAPSRHLHHDVGRLDHAHRLVADLEVELLGGLSSHQADKPMRTRDELDNRGHAITLNARHDAGEAISRGLGNDRPPNGFPAPRRLHQAVYARGTGRLHRCLVRGSGRQGMSPERWVTR